jgi:hypothetical protein
MSHRGSATTAQPSDGSPPALSPTTQPMQTAGDLATLTPATRPAEGGTFSDLTGGTGMLIAPAATPPTTAPSFAKSGDGLTFMPTPGAGDATQPSETPDLTLPTRIEPDKDSSEGRRPLGSGEYAHVVRLGHKTYTPVQPDPPADPALAIRDWQPSQSTYPTGNFIAGPTYTVPSELLGKLDSPYISWVTESVVFIGQTVAAPVWMIVQNPQSKVEYNAINFPPSMTGAFPVPAETPQRPTLEPVLSHEPMDLTLTPTTYPAVIEPTTGPSTAPSDLMLPMNLKMAPTIMPFELPPLPAPSGGLLLGGNPDLPLK